MIKIKFIFILVNIMFAQTLFANAMRIVKIKPHDFVNVQEIIPSIRVDMKYYGSDNFVGRRIKGYSAPLCLLTEKAALALKSVQERLIQNDLSLIVYDCYRPQTSVNDFVQWAQASSDNKFKAKYYPNVNKSNLFKEGYIAYHSGHSRGSTVDLSIVSIDSRSKILPDTLNFGSSFDFFDPSAHLSYKESPAQVKINRLFLRNLMMGAGFLPLETEWWHFTLKNEPYPNTYFDFPIVKN